MCAIVFDTPFTFPFACAGVNTLCGTCMQGLSRVGQNCVDCHASDVTTNWFLFVLIGVSWVGFLIFIAAYAGASARKRILFYFVQTMHIVLGPSSTWYAIFFLYCQ